MKETGKVPLSQRGMLGDFSPSHHQATPVAPYRGHPEIPPGSLRLIDATGHELAPAWMMIVATGSAALTLLWIHDGCREPLS